MLIILQKQIVLTITALLGHKGKQHWLTYCVPSTPPGGGPLILHPGEGTVQGHRVSGRASMQTQVGLTQCVLSVTPPSPTTAPQNQTTVDSPPTDPACSSPTSLPLTLAILLGPADTVHSPWSETEVSTTTHTYEEGGSERTGQECGFGLREAWLQFQLPLSCVSLGKLLTLSGCAGLRAGKRRQ